MPNRLGVIKSGAFADIVIVDGNPISDISLLTNQGLHMPAIMKNGIFYKNTL